MAAHRAVELPGPPHVLLLLHSDDVALVEGEVVLSLGPPGIEGDHLHALRGLLSLWEISLKAYNSSYLILFAHCK